MLGHTVVWRLPAAELTSLNLDEVNRIPALGDDVNLVVSYAPIALDDVEPSIA